MIDTAEIKALKEIARELAKIRRELTEIRRAIKTEKGDDEEECED